MFTVKQQDSGGNVWLRNCAVVDIDVDGEMVWLRMRDASGKEIAFRNGWLESEKECDMVYIMNANGATVHSFKLRVSAACSLRHSDECQAAQMAA